MCWVKSSRGIRVWWVPCRQFLPVSVLRADSTRNICKKNFDFLHDTETVLKLLTRKPPVTWNRPKSTTISVPLRSPTFPFRPMKTENSLCKWSWFYRKRILEIFEVLRMYKHIHIYTYICISSSLLPVASLRYTHIVTRNQIRIAPETF